MRRGEYLERRWRNWPGGVIRLEPRRISIVQCGRINVRFRGRYLDALHEEQFECSIKPGNRQNRVKWSNYSIRGEPFVRITVVAITVIARGT